MDGTRRTTILATAAVAVPLLARQIVVGEKISGGSGKKQKPDPLTLVKGLTAAFEVTYNQTDNIEAEEEH